jgi:hypothetical protein
VVGGRGATAGANFGGGGGGGYSGGGGQGYSEDVYSGGGGGGSFLAQAFADPVMVAGEHVGDGSVTIDLISTPPPAAPEPSTWAMALAGFGGLGWLARLRARHKVTSALRASAYASPDQLPCTLTTMLTCQGGSVGAA